LDHHPWEEEVIESLLPTLLVALLALSIPPILLLIAKKMHTITTLSALHDLIMTRYYKFLIVNVLVFFCVGTAALQSFLGSIGSSAQLLNVVAMRFPAAGPFYVGWCKCKFYVTSSQNAPVQIYSDIQRGYAWRIRTCFMWAF
jgi:hypothetical protein